MPTPRKTLIVGAGVTGATIARLLQDASRSLQSTGDVLVWDKNSIAGGRMMARSFRKNRSVHVDMGAQYLTKFSSANDDVRGWLLQQGKLTPFEDSAIQQDGSRPSSTNPQDHTVSLDRHGFRAVVESLLTGATVQLSREVDRIELVDDKSVKILSTDGHVEIVDDLVFTCPIPNLLPILQKSTLHVDPKQLHALERVTYSQRFAVALLFDKAIAPHVHELGWTSKYVAREQDEIVRFLCWDNLKKQQGDNAFALLVHTGVPFGVKHMNDKQKNDEILATIVRSVKKLLPFLPDPEDSILHRWRISQTTQMYHESNVNAPSITLCSSPRILVAGDAFLGSGFDNCVLSAKHATQSLLTESNSSMRSGL